jgi:AcrR family transcriptional regulator
MKKDDVIRCAVDIADRDGLDALSMRRLAQELGVEAMSLYHYVRSKDELVTEMTDLALSEIEVARPDQDWKDALRTTSVSARDALRRHRWASGRLMSTGPSPAQMRRMEAVLSTLERAGFSPDQVDQAYHALESHIVGFTLWLASMPFKKEGDLERAASTYLKDLPAELYPHVLKHAHHHLAPRVSGRKTEFEFGLDLILDGLERLLHERGARRAPAVKRERVRA